MRKTKYFLESDNLEVLTCLILWEKINTKPLVTIYFLKIFDKTNNFAILICCAVPVPTNLHIMMQN